MTTILDWGHPPQTVKHLGLEVAKAWFRDEAATCVHGPAPTPKCTVLAVNGAVYCRECTPTAASFTLAAHPTCTLCHCAPSTVGVMARPVPALLGFRLLLTLCRTCATGDTTP